MNSDPAFARWIVIQLVRILGVALTVTGILGMVGKIAMPQLTAYVVAAAGLIAASVFPLLLARRWRSPRP
jgi:hypothetical protein